MFQAELRPARLLKQIVEALKEVVVEIQIECSAEGMVVQAMDSSHVSLVGLELNGEKFQSYRCEKPHTLGINCGNLAKMLKCAGNDDTVKLTAQEDGDTLHIRLFDETEDRVSEFSMKLIEIDQDSMGIPDMQYQTSVTMPSSELARICKDIANFGDTVTVDVKKDGVSFSAQGDIGTGRMLLKATKEIDVPAAKKEKKEATEEGTPKKEVPTKEEPTKEETAVKTEPTTPKEKEGGESTPKETEGTPKSTETPKEGEVKAEGDAAAAPPAKRRKTEAEKEAEKAKKDEEKAKKDAERAQKKEQKEADKEEEERRKALLQAVRINCDEPVTLQFALRYLTMFSKAQAVSDVVVMKLAKDTPMMMEFGIELPSNLNKDAAAGTAEDERMGTLRYYLAPKVGDGEENEGEAAPAADE